MNVNPIERQTSVKFQRTPAISFADHLAAAQHGLHICGSCFRRVDQVFQEHKCKTCLKAEADRFRHLFDKDRKH